MKRRSLETFLSRLDHALRWTGIPARVAEQMSEGPPADRRRPLRWVPLWPIAFSCAVLILSLAGQAAPWQLSLCVSVNSINVALLPLIVMNGPLGGPSYEDDEREAALRRDAYLFCLGLIAVLNCVGQPVLMITSHWQHWELPQILNVSISGLMLNATLIGSLPTLYGSWNLPQLSNE